MEDNGNTIEFRWILVGVTILLVAALLVIWPGKKTRASNNTSVYFTSSFSPSTTMAWNLGVSGNSWLSIDQIIYFSGSNVGIGTSTPQQTLEVNGGMTLYNATTSVPGCSSTSSRGTMWFVPAATGTLELCVQSATGTYSWVHLYN